MTMSNSIVKRRLTRRVRIGTVTVGGDAPVASAPAPQAVSATKSVAKQGLRFSFAQPSWVEVRDRNDKVIFSQLNSPGSEPEITGQPPFSLVIGNASQVTLLYKGKNVELSNRSKDDVVRLTLE